PVYDYTFSFTTEEPTIEEVEDLSDITVLRGTPIDLADEVKGKLSNGSEVKIPVLEWLIDAGIIPVHGDDLSSMPPGTYDVIAKIGIFNIEVPLKITITMNEPAFVQADSQPSEIKDSIINADDLTNGIEFKVNITDTGAIVEDIVAVKAGDHVV